MARSSSMLLKLSSFWQEASDKGFFRPNGERKFGYILTAAADIAAGMAFLHARGVVHGDLTGGNVLLATDTSSPNGVVAKVADFGLARAMEVQSKIETRTYGTVTHMPPELLEKGISSKVSSALEISYSNDLCSEWRLSFVPRRKWITV